MPAYFTTLMNSKHFKNDIFGFNTSQAKYLSKKSAMIFACPLPFNLAFLDEAFIINYVFRPF